MSRMDYRTINTHVRTNSIPIPTVSSLSNQKSGSDFGTAMSLPGSPSDVSNLGPRRSILKKASPISGYEVKSRANRSKSVSFSVPDDFLQSRRDRNPILKVLEAFDRRFSNDCDVSAAKSKPNTLDSKSDDKSNISTKADGPIPLWITYLPSERRRVNSIDRSRFSNINLRRDTGNIYSCRSNSLSSERNALSQADRSNYLNVGANHDDTKDKYQSQPYARSSPCAQSKINTTNGSSSVIRNNNNNSIYINSRASTPDSSNEKKNLYWRSVRTRTYTPPSY